MARARRRVKDRPDWADGAALVVKCVTIVTPMPPSQSIPRDFLGIEVQECASISRCSDGSWLTILAEPSFEADSLPGYILAALSVRDSNSGHARPHFFSLDSTGHTYETAHAAAMRALRETTLGLLMEGTK